MDSAQQLPSSAQFPALWSWTFWTAPLIRPALCPPIDWKNDWKWMPFLNHLRQLTTMARRNWGGHRAGRSRNCRGKECHGYGWPKRKGGGEVKKNEITRKMAQNAKKMEKEFRKTKNSPVLWKRRHRTKSAERTPPLPTPAKKWKIVARKLLFHHPLIALN